MAHYALLDENNIVINVITGIDEDIIQTDLDGAQVGGSSEAWEQFYASRPWFKGLTCKRTSYNTFGNIHLLGGTAFRGNFAGINFKYDADFDAFIAPQPYPSWKLNYTTYQWEAPVLIPSDWMTILYKWDESTLSWVEIPAGQ